MNRRTWQQLGLSLGLMVLAIPNALASPLLWRIAEQSPSNQDLLLEELFSLAQAEDLREEADLLWQKGFEPYQRGQFREAVRFWEQELAVYRELGDRTGEGRVLENLGSAYRSLGESERAIDLFEQSLTIAREIGDRTGEGRVLENLGSAYRNLGESERAIDLFEQSLTITREIGDRVWEAAMLVNLSHAYLRLGQYEQALEPLEQRLAIVQELRDRSGEGITLRTWGSAYLSLGRYKQAINFYEKSLSIFREIGDREREGSTLGNMGAAYRNLGEYKQAIDFLGESLTIAREIGDRQGEGRALGNLGRVIDELDEHERAIDFYEKSLTIARELKDRQGEGDILGNLGGAYLGLGESERAIDFYQQFLAIARETGDRDGEGTALSNLGLVYLLTQQPILAENALTMAADIRDSLRSAGLNDADKISLFESQQRTFRFLQQALIAQDKYESALEIAERGRARAFAELLFQRLATEDEDVNITPPNLEEITAFAQQQQTTLVEYSIIRFTDNYFTDDFDPQLYIWVISPDGNITFRQQPLTDIDLSTLVTTTRQTIGVRGSRNAKVPYEIKPEVQEERRAQRDRQLTQLHDLLVTPIADLLPTNPEKNVIFIPQGELFLVPFPALKDPNGKYLLEKHTILTAPSIQVLQLTDNIATDRTATNRNPLIVGNPTMPTVTFLSDEGNFEDITLSPLSGAATEARNIADFLNASPLLGDAATEATVKQQIASADSIHLATHGLLEYGDPQQTGSRDLPGAIALASGSGEDGLLTSSEILQLDLQANLVVLSACDTGRGRITGDGVIGLSRAFVAAGVPSIVVSLWSVPDAPTAELMREFYAQLDAGQPKAQALRQAMLTTMETHPDPKDWAAFTLIGEGE